MDEEAAVECSAELLSPTAAAALCSAWLGSAVALTVSLLGYTALSARRARHRIKRDGCITCSQAGAPAMPNIFL